MYRKSDRRFDLYELPDDVPASAKTRARYAEFARAFYASCSTKTMRHELRYDVDDPHSPFVNLNNDAERLKFALDGTQSACATRYRIYPTNAPAYHGYDTYEFGDVLGIHVPVGVKTDIRCSYDIHAHDGVRRKYEPGNESFVHRGSPTLPLSTALSVARGVEPQSAITGHVFYPLRFPYVSELLEYGLFLDVPCDIHITYVHSEMPIYHTSAFIDACVFYNPIQNVVENYYGEKIT